MKIIIPKLTTKIIPKIFNILIIISASFSVLFIFSTNTCLISLFNNSSILTLSALDNNFNWVGLGAVSPNSQFDIVCLVTLIFSANCSYESLQSFLSLKILSPNFILISPFTNNYICVNIIFLPNVFGILSKTFNNYNTNNYYSTSQDPKLYLLQYV